MNVRQLQIAADQMRLDILDEITTAQSGHIGGRCRSANCLRYFMENT